MRLYLTHSSNFDYETELYEPFRQSLGQKHEIFFPHDENNKKIKSKDIIPKYDIILAEVSYPSTGQGIELGWADSNNIPIVCFYKTGSKVSSSLGFISNTIFEYKSIEDAIHKLETKLK